jgi:thiamine-phosphate pyrophosphorylase
MGTKTSKGSVLDRFKAARLYAITTAPAVGQTIEDMVRAACQGGVDVLQLRDKGLAQQRDRFQLAQRLRDICHAHGVLFIVNDFLEVAMASGADGVHFGQDDMAIDVARKILHQNGVGNFLIGRSTHSLAQAQKAELEGADYIAIGPVFLTPTKPTYEPVGIELVRDVVSQVKTPHVAIGGIDVTNVQQVLEAWAQCVAVVRAVCGAANIQAAAKSMKEAMSHEAYSR